MNTEKLIHQLFIGKVVEEIGFKRTAQLLKQAKEEINIYENKKIKNSVKTKFIND